MSKHVNGFDAPREAPEGAEAYAGRQRASRRGETAYCITIPSGAKIPGGNAFIADFARWTT